MAYLRATLTRVMNVDDGDGIRFVTRNPKRPRTAAWQRYEQYKVATTVGDALKLGAMRCDIRHDLKHCFASKIRGAAEASLHAAPGAAEASLHAAPSSILAASTDWAAPASSHTSPSVGASREGNDSNGEALEIVFPDEGDEAERREQTQDLRAQLQAERMVVSQLRDEVQRLAGHAESLQAQLQAERAAVSQIEKEAQVYQKEAAVAQQKIAELKEKNSRDGGVENKTGKAHAIELALSACAHVESRAEVGQLRDTRAWVSWVGDHLPHDMLCKHHPRVVAALLLHAAWCMEFGDGFPFAQCLVRAIESTRDGHTSCLPFTRQAPLLAMKFLNLSAMDCGKAAELHCKLLMLLAKSPPRGLPWETQA